MNCSIISNSSPTPYVNPSTVPALAVKAAPVSTSTNTEKPNAVAQAVLSSAVSMQQPEKAKGALKQDEILPSLPTEELVQKLLAIENIPAFFAASNGKELESLKSRFNDIATHILGELRGNLRLAGDSKKNLLGVIQNYVTEVNFPTYCYMRAENIAEVLDFFPAKQKVTLYVDDITQEQYQVFTEHCHDLKQLYLPKCQQLASAMRGGEIVKNNPSLPKYQQLTSEILGEILKNNPHLQALGLDKGELSDEMLSVIAKECTNLETFICKWTSGSIRGDALAAVLRSNPGLRNLSLRLSYEHFTDDCVRAIQLYGTNLQSVDLEHCYEITGESCREFAAFTDNKLQDLDLACCYNLKAAGLENILRHFPHLQSLNLHLCLGLSDTVKVDEKWIRQFCPDIKKLILPK